MADFPDFPMFEAPPTPEETALARAAALKRTRDVEGLRSIGLLGSILGGNAGPMGKAFADQGQQIEEQGTKLAQTEAARRDHALSRAMALSNAKALAEERAIDNKRQELGMANLEDQRKWMRDHPTQIVFPGQEGAVGVPTRQGVGTPQPIQAPGGGQPLLKDRPVDEKTLKDLSQLDDEAAAVAKLGAKFKPEYAASGMLGGPLGALKVAGAQFMGASAPKSTGLFGGQFTQDAANWWSEFERRVQMPARHELFGAALTPTERDIWARAQTIKPGSSPEEIQRAWSEMEEVIRRKPAQIRAGLASQHYNPTAPAQAPGAGAGQPRTVTQNGVTYTLNPETGEYE